MKFQVTSKWVDNRSSIARCKDAVIALDTALDDNPDSFQSGRTSAWCFVCVHDQRNMRVSPMLDFKLTGIEVLLTGVRQDVPHKKGIMRVSPMLDFKLTGIEVLLTGVRQDVPPKMESIDYEIIIDSYEERGPSRTFAQKRKEVWHRFHYYRRWHQVGWRAWLKMKSTVL